jgi:type I restriction enzyme S subunit
MTSANDLPNGWLTTTLGAIRLDRSTSVDPSKSKTETFELYSIPAFPSGHPEVISGSEIGSTKKSLDPSTVVVSKINPRINRVWVVGERTVHRQIGSSEWITFFPIKGLEPKYIAYYMRQDAFRNFLAANVSGVGGSLMRVKPSTVDPYPLVLAPSTEQHRIVEAIESYFTRLDDAVATLERVQRNLKRYRASVLKAAVEGRLVPTEAERARAEGRDYEPASVLLDRILAERRRRWEEAELAKMKAKGKAPKDDKWKAKYQDPAVPDATGLPKLPQGWCWATLPQIGELNRGKSKHRPRNDPRLLGGPYPFIQTGDVRHSKGFITEHAATYSELGLSQSHLWPAGTLCITIAANIADTGILKFDACFPDSVVGFLNEGEPTLVRFVELFIRTAKEELERYAPATAQKNINLEVLSAVAVPLPPPAEQARLVTEVDRLLSVSNSAEEEAAHSILRLARLHQSILKWAFEGRLVDQDPTDEPASALLARIRAERTPVAGRRNEQRPAGTSTRTKRGTPTSPSSERRT